MRVSLAQRPIAAPPCPADPPPPALLDPAGARVILGGVPRGGFAAAPIRPGPATLFGPRGACLAAPDGPLFVSDTGHHRALVWHRRPECDGEPADLVLGHRDFRAEAPNDGGSANAATLKVPTGIAFGAGVLAVADAWNHRVLLWHGLPRHSGQPADVVLGQADFCGNRANRGLPAPRADSLNWCYGVAIADRRLIVADTGNRRVLVWDELPERNGAPADLVLGQADFSGRDEAAGGATGAVGMRWPHAALADNGVLLVADAGASRVMVWRHFPAGNGAPCDFALGQPSLSTAGHNGGEWAPTATRLNMPYGIARLGGHVVVADTANSRLIGYAISSLGLGAPANRLSGQSDFGARGDNRWQAPARDSVNWPYGIAACGGTAVVADSGNDRVLLWDAR